VQIWREYRQMTQTALAEASGVDRAYLSEIESGKKPGSVEVWSDKVMRWGWNFPNTVSVGSLARSSRVAPLQDQSHRSDRSGQRPDPHEKWLLGCLHWVSDSQGTPRRKRRHRGKREKFLMRRVRTLWKWNRGSLTTP